MLATGKQKTIAAFSLIEIIVSLAIFSTIMSTVVVISLDMIQTQKRIQSQLFLVQTAQTALENISRQLRYGYNYSGSTEATYTANNQEIRVNTNDISITNNAAASNTQILVNAKNSPFVLFESQGGNPNLFTDQQAFCVKDGILRKISIFTKDLTDPNVFKARCEDGNPVLPESITVDKISFDIYGGSSENPKNPMVRIKMRLKHLDTGGQLDIQSTVTQRLITYF